MTLVYPEPGEESYGCLECGWDVPLVDGQIPTTCEECGDPASEARDPVPAYCPACKGRGFDALGIFVCLACNGTGVERSGPRRSEAHTRELGAADGSLRPESSGGTHD